MKNHADAAKAELWVDGGDCPDIEAFREVLDRQLACLKEDEPCPWVVSADFRRQSWQPTAEEEQKLAQRVQEKSGLSWGRVLLPEQVGERIFPKLHPDVDWKERFTDGKTALIRQNLRSGQNFYTRGNVVILGDVNPGAEVIAGGSILVIGALRGMAHAGRFGDEGKVVAALKMQPIQIRIAEHITRPPDGEQEEHLFPEIAKIRDGRVLIEAMDK